jgi:hypothetical protein
MLALIAAVLFVIAFLLKVAGAGAAPVITPFSLMLLGLACLALHLGGWLSGWRPRRR